MHVPDGFLAPVTWIPAAALAAGGAGAAVRRARRTFDGREIPRLAVLTALAFTLGSIAVPIPGGTSVHASGVAILALRFGLPTAYLATLGVLALQALLFGVGGATSLGLNALTIGGVGALAAVAGARLLAPLGRATARAGAGWLSVVMPAVVLGLALGWQPHLGTAPDGTPLWFPFGWRVALPALLVPGAIAGIGEAALTVVALRLLDRIAPGRSPSPAASPENDR